MVALAKSLSVISIFTAFVGFILFYPIMTAAQSPRTWSEKYQDFKLGEQHMSVSEASGYPVFTFDEASAQTAGVSQSGIALLNDVTAFQNKWLLRAYNSKTFGTPFEKVDLSDYPAADKFAKEAKKNADNSTTEGNGQPRSGSSSIGFPYFYEGAVAFAESSPHRCGNMDHPLPNFRPPEHYGTAQDAYVYLHNQGYHITATYVRAVDRAGPNDHTKARGYVSVLGTCPSPLFRNHAVVIDGGRTRYWIQYGEPNPEVLAAGIFRWPYLTWPYYVAWWHDEF